MVRRVLTLREQGAPMNQLKHIRHRWPLRHVALLPIVCAMAVACSRHDGAAMDETRELDALKISYQLSFYKLAFHRLPQALRDMEGFLDWRAPVDPVTHEPYDYRLLDANDYELCVTFDAKNEPGEGRPPGIRYGDPVTHGYGSWVHGAGRQCVRRSLPY